jgi:hypothetical protein
VTSLTNFSKETLNFFIFKLTGILVYVFLFGLSKIVGEIGSVVLVDLGRNFIKPEMVAAILFLPFESRTGLFLWLA